MRNTVFVLLIASFALSGCLSRSPQPAEQTVLSAEQVELPATFVNGLPYVDLQINGQGPYRFLIDSGSDGMEVPPRVACEAKILFSRKNTIKINGTSGRSEDFPIATIDRIDCALFSLRGVRASIMSSEADDAFASLGVKNFGGVIGLPPFKNVLLEIDYPQKIIRVARLGSATPAPEEGIPYTGLIPHVTIATPSAKHLTTPVVIDTGSEGDISLNDIADYPTRVGLTKGDEYFLGVGGYHRPRYGQLAGEIRLGPVIWRDPVIRDSAVANLIGSHALAPWKLVIDQKKKLLWLVGDEKIITTTTWPSPLDPDGRPAVYGFASIPDGEAFIVKEVDQGSRAERAGLKPGDRYRWLSPSPSTSEGVVGHTPLQVRLRVIRGSEKFEITMSLLAPLPTITAPAAAVPEGKAAGGQN